MPATSIGKALAPPRLIRYKRSPVPGHRTIENRGLAAVISLGGVLLVAASLLTAGGCSRKIGDACSNSADCDPTGGTRSCDLSQPGGYCLIEGCDARSCPEDSVCVRLFPDSFLAAATLPCDADWQTGCAADEICVPSGKPKAGVCKTATTCELNDQRLTSSCAPGELCLSSGGTGVCARVACDPALGDADCGMEGSCVTLDSPGVCARRSWEKRVCVQSCGNNGDCRGGYVCRRTGTDGAVKLTISLVEHGFCAPDPK